MSWIAVRVRPTGDRAAAAAALFDAGSQGVLDDTDGSMLTSFPPDVDIDAIRTAIALADPGATVEVTDLPDEDWTEQWKPGIRAHQLGSLTIAPPWLAADLDPASTVIIDPEMAFGTGEHPTTRCVMRLMHDAVKPGNVLADCGAGSAVLSIAAAKLGAARVAAIELDPDAFGNATANVERNGVGDRVTVITGDAVLLLPLVAPLDGVFGNIVSSVLLDLLPVMAASLRPKGWAIVSGILHEEREMMARAFDAGGWDLVADDSEDIWWSARIARR